MNFWMIDIHSERVRDAFLCKTGSVRAICVTTLAVMSSPVDAQLRRHDCHDMGQIAQGLCSGSSPRCGGSMAKYREKRSQPRGKPSKCRLGSSS